MRFGPLQLLTQKMQTQAFLFIQENGDIDSECLQLLSELKDHRIPASLEVGRILKFTNLSWHHEGIQNDEHEQYITGKEVSRQNPNSLGKLVKKKWKQPVPLLPPTRSRSTTPLSLSPCLSLRLSRFMSATQAMLNAFHLPGHTLKVRASLHNVNSIHESKVRQSTN